LQDSGNILLRMCKNLAIFRLGENRRDFYLTFDAKKSLKLMRTNHYFKIDIGLLLILCCVPVHATLYLDRQDNVELAGHLAAFPDPQTEFTIHDVVDKTFTSLGGHLNDGFGEPRGMWLKFTLQTGAQISSQWYLRVLPTYIDQVDLYHYDVAKGWQRTQGGLFHTTSAPLPDRTALLSLQLTPNTTETFYVYVYHQGPHLAAYSTLLTASALQHTVITESLWFGIYYGLAVTLIFINFLSFLVLKERIYLLLLMYIFCSSLFYFIVNGHFSQFVVLNEPLHLRHILSASVSLGAASLALFLVRFLDVSQRFPHLARLYHVIAIALFVLGIALFLNIPTQFVVIALLSVIFMLISGLGIAIAQYYAKHPHGRLFIVVIPIFTLGHWFAVFGGLGLLDTHLFVDLYGNQVASALGFLLLHYAVTVQVKQILLAKEASEKSAQLAMEIAQHERTARHEQADFVAMLFHEIKTPLTVIDSATTVLELLDDGYRCETAQRYDAIHHAVERLNRLVEQSLSRERQRLDDIHLNLQPTDLRTLTRIVVDSFHTTVPPLRIDVSTSVPLVQADPELLRIALANLVDNAIKYSPSEQDIHIHLDPQPDYIQLRVRDQGIGIDKPDKIFDRFWRSSRTSNVAGAGLVCIWYNALCMPMVVTCRCSLHWDKAVVLS
jgi:signal transduction histidine kinase